MQCPSNAFFVLSSDGTVRAVSDGARDLLDLPSDDAVVGLPLADRVAPEHVPQLRAQVDSVARGGGEATCRAALIGGGRTLAEYEVTLSRLVLAGEPVVLARVDPAPSPGKGWERTFRSLFGLDPAAVASLDRNGRLTRANAAWARLTGSAPGDRPGSFVESVVAPEEREVVRARLAAAAGGEPQRLQTVIVGAGGARMDVSARLVPVVEPGEPAEVLAFLDDVTERLRAERNQDTARHLAEMQAAQLSDLAAELELSNQELLEAVARADQAKELAETAAAEQRALIEAIGEVVLVIDAHGRYVRVPPAAPNLLFRPPVELEGKRMHDVLPAESADAFLAVIRRSLETGAPVTMEYDLPIDGRRTWFLGIASPMSADRVVWVARDITDRKEAEALLQASEERYRLVFDANPLPMWIFDRATLRFLMVNSAALAQYGYTRDEFLALRATDIRLPDDVARFRAQIALGVAGLHRTGRWRHRRKDGSTFTVEVVSHTVVLDGREAVLVLALDVTDREVAERALRASEATFRTLVQASPVAIVRLDEHLLPQLWNAAAERVFGWAEAEVLGRPLPFLAPDATEQFASAWERLRLGEAFAGVELRAVRRDGARVEVSVSAAPLRGEDGSIEGFIVSAADVSAARELERELRHSQKLDAIGRLAGGIAHDFNNLLTVIKGNAELALAELDPSHPARADLDEVAATAARAANLTRQLLTFSRKQVTEPGLYELNAIVGQMDKLLHRVLGENIELRAVLDPDAGFIRADLGQMEQVLLNLAVNARDAMPARGTLTVRTLLAPLPAGAGLELAPSEHGYVALQVEDTGSGIAPELLDRIFEPFYTTKPHGQGTGLGLSTAYGIVKQGGGTIRVRSEVGRGTTFEIVLPRFAADGAETGGASAAAPHGTGSLLLVEDDASVRSVTRRILERFGYRVQVAANGEEADAVLSSGEHIDLLITDVVMPGVSGKEVAERARESHPNIRVLFMSGYTDETISRHGVLDPGVEFIHKPFRPDAIAQRVHQVLSAPRP